MANSKARSKITVFPNAPAPGVVYHETVFIIMKTILSVLASVAFTLQAFGIPQTFNNNNNPFFLQAGMPFEQAAGQPGAFEPGAELKGEWAPMQGKKDTLRLKLEAVVFGIQASEITAEKSGDRVTKFRVV